MRKILLVTLGVLLFPVLILALCFLINRIVYSGSITRSQLGIATSESGPACKNPLPPFSTTQVSDGPDAGKEVREAVSQRYFPEAVLSLDAYVGDKSALHYKDSSGHDEGLRIDPKRYLDLIQFEPAAGEDGLLRNLPGNLAMDVWERRSDPDVIYVAFRGTNDNFDWYNNFTWITYFLPWQNAYAEARHAFADLRMQVSRKYPGKVISYIVTGHSLGGGLADEIARGFPCVFAVTFNRSPVTNTYMYRDPYPDIQNVDIFEDMDELTYVRHLISGKDTDTDQYRWFMVNVSDCHKQFEKQKKGSDANPANGSDDSDATQNRWRKLGSVLFELIDPKACQNFQHSMLGLAVGMAGLVANCQVGPGGNCKGYLDMTDLSALNAYCSTNGLQDLTICRKYVQ